MAESVVSEFAKLGQSIESYADRAPGISKEQLETELADARLLHKLSIQLIQEDGTAGLYKKIVEAAVAIMRSQFATMQMLFPDAGNSGKLKMLASSGFTPEAEQYWKWVYEFTASSCGEVLRSRKRVVIPDYAACDFMQGSVTLPVFLESGILAAQSTPLYSRTGKLLGMISTHWDHPYTPPQRHLEMLDILARQAADLIERTKTEEALRESESRLRALATATNDVIYRMNADWTELHQLDGRNFLADSTESDANWLKKYILGEDHDRIRAVFQQAISTKSTFQFEHRVIKADGTTGWVLSRAIPILDDSGTITEWFGAASDITEKKSILSRLEQMVDERTKELQRSNEDLQKFAHVASHDLKEPVRKIRTFGLRLKNELDSCLNDNARIYTDKILESAARMRTMVEGVLTYSTLNTTDQPMGIVDLNKTIEDIRNDLELMIEERGAVIRHGQLPSIEGIPVLIHQLFFNLINNSLKFSKKDREPVITIESGVVAQDGAPSAMITVTDNGIGFSPQYNEKVFEAFARLHSKTEFDGTGLGLSLSRKIVERHKGTISAHGTGNDGAVFQITLPLQRHTR